MADPRAARAPGSVLRGPAAERPGAGLSWRRFVPREHGVWFMWIVPLVLGTAQAGAGWGHALLAAGALAVHFASHAALEAMRSGARGGAYRRAAAVFSVAAALALAYPVLRHPVVLPIGAAAAGLLLFNLSAARRREERTLLNDAAGIAALQLWAPVAYVVGGGTAGPDAWRLWALTFLFFMGTAFHVKTLFRECGDRRFKSLSNALHAALLVAPAALGVPEAGWAYAPSAARTWVMPAGRRLKPLTAGIVEITNSAAFTAILLWVLGRS